MTPTPRSQPDESQVGRLLARTAPASVQRSLNRAAKALETQQAKKRLGTLAAGVAIALRRSKAVEPSSNHRESCAECGAKIPPGKAGRKCQDCRRAAG